MVTLIAWFVAVRALWRRREDGAPDPRFALLLAPLGALIGQLHFATKYPNDNFGPDQGFLPAVHRARAVRAVRRGRRLDVAAARAPFAGGWRRWFRWARSGWSRAYSLNARLPPLDKSKYTTAPFFATAGRGP